MKNGIAIAILGFLVFALEVSVQMANADPLWENTRMTGNQGINAFAATGDKWFLEAADFLGGAPTSVYGSNIHINSYQDGPWRISFNDYGTAHYKSWPNAIATSNNDIAWHSIIYATNGGAADIYVIQYPYAVTAQLGVNAIEEELLNQRGVANSSITYNYGYVAGNGFSAAGTQEYAKFILLADVGPSYALLLITDNRYVLNNVGNSIKVS
jgi:hypothetical protein